MVIYHTRHTRYTPEEINGKTVIRAFRGPLAGEPFEILGSYNPDEIEVTYDSVERMFLVGGRSVPFEGLAGSLQKDIQIGRVILAQRINEHGNPIFQGETKSILRTYPITYID